MLWSYIDMSEDNDKVICGAYYDADNGFGSINATYKQAHHILNTNIK